MVHPITKRITWFFFSRFVKSIKGLENLPPPPAIIAANHESDIDGPLIYFLITKFTNKKVFPIVTDERAKRFGDLLIRHFGGTRVKSRAVLKSVQALCEGKYVLVFPEGQRTWTGKLEKCTATGTGVLAILTKAPVIPIRIKSYSFYSRHMRRPSWKKEIEIIFGKPRTFNGKIKSGWVNKADAKKVVAKVMKQISVLK